MVARHPEVAFSPRGTLHARISGSGTRGETVVVGVGWAAYSSPPDLVSDSCLLPRAVLATLNGVRIHIAWASANHGAYEHGHLYLMHVDFGFVSTKSGSNATDLVFAIPPARGERRADLSTSGPAAVYSPCPSMRVGHNPL